MIRKGGMLSPVLAIALVVVILAGTYVLVTQVRDNEASDVDTASDLPASAEPTASATATPPADSTEDVDQELKEIEADITDIEQNELSEDALSDTSLGL